LSKGLAFGRLASSIFLLCGRRQRRGGIGLVVCGGGVFPFVEIDPVGSKSTIVSEGALNGFPNALEAGDPLAS
jgi:hypothetical protein